MMGSGVGVTAATFHDLGSPWRLVGLTLVIIGATTASTGIAAHRSRSLEEEFDAGYRVGYRAGRRAPTLVPVSPIRAAAGGLTEFNRGAQHGRIPKAPLGALPSHRAAAGRAQADPH
jgi:hypothetical protein